METKTAGTGLVQFIKTANIYPHPDNPRRELGDLTELAESVKACGILQPLTVVPREEEEGTYTVVIGHRRLAAAKLAGAVSVPCSIAMMSRAQQIRLMLIENMQRSDLTPYEQAQGFQLMMDLGDSVEQISERTGFSQTTVRRRVKLLELDKRAFQAAEERGATLADYARLEEIEDIDARNAALRAYGTSNFWFIIKNAVREQKLRARVTEWLDEIKGYAAPFEEAPDRWRFVEAFGLWNLDKAVRRPDDADEVNYYYKDTKRGIDIYRELTAAEEDVKAAEGEKDRKERALQEAVREAKKTHFELRTDFVKKLTEGALKKAVGLTASFMADAAWGRNYFDGGLLGELLEIDLSEDELSGSYTLPTDEPGIAEAARERPYKLMFCVAYCTAEDSDDPLSYIIRKWEKGAAYYRHRNNPILDRVYETLEALGYAISDDERAMMEGTHPIFRSDYGAPDPDDE